MTRYRHDPDHPARLNRQGKPEPTRQPRYGNRLYCLVWAEQDLFKLGLGSGKNARDASALQSITKYFAHEAVTPDAFSEWRAEIPELDGVAWGDCQRLEMVFAAAAKRHLGADAADAVGLEWLTREGLEEVDWKLQLAAATAQALAFCGLKAVGDWKQHTRMGVATGPVNARIHGPSQLDAHRTMRNKRGVCALKGCDAALGQESYDFQRFRYCSEAHARVDHGGATRP